jgi:hypothetical protein
LGLATVGISLIDLLLDLFALRPVIGDGLPQVAGFASGALLARERLSALFANEKVAGVLNTLKQYQATLGFASIGFGVVHLLLGGFVLV